MSIRAMIQELDRVASSAQSRRRTDTQIQPNGSVRECAAGSASAMADAHGNINPSLITPLKQSDRSIALAAVISSKPEAGSRRERASRCMTSNSAWRIGAKVINAPDHLQIHADVGLPRRRFAIRSVERVRYIDERENQEERDLTGAGTYQSPRQTFLRRGVKLFGCIPNGGLLGSRRLLHQKAREHAAAVSSSHCSRRVSISFFRLDAWFSRESSNDCNAGTVAC